MNFPLDFIDYERIRPGEHPLWEFLQGSLTHSSIKHIKYGRRLIIESDGDHSKLTSINSDRLSQIDADVVCFEKWAQGDLYHSGRGILSNGSWNAIFKECSFRSLSSISERSRHLYFTECHGLTLSKARLSGKGISFYRCRDVKLGILSSRGPVSFLNCEFSSFQLGASNEESALTGYFDVSNSRILCTPVLENIYFSQEVYIGEGNSYEDHSRSSEGQYRELKKKFSENHNASEEAFFFSHELQTKYLTNTRKWTFMYLMGQAYWLINRMGRSVTAPLIPIALFAMVFSLIDILIFYCAGYSRLDLTLENFPEALIILNNLFLPFLYLTVPKANFEYAPTLWRFWGVFQVLIMAVLYFFLIYGVRKRFKLN